ncbi:MAG: hypothetical protein AAFX01_08030 [Cyanobacteria bacterium J06638_28]
MPPNPRFGELDFPTPLASSTQLLEHQWRAAIAGTGFNSEKPLNGTIQAL